MASSHNYQVITNEVLRLSEELRALGGGDATVSRLEVLCRVCPVQGYAGIISAHDGVIMVRDPRQSEDMPAEKLYRKYKIPRTFGSGATQSDIFRSVGPGLLDWVLDGFNAAVLTLGQTGTGKTYTLFGPGGAHSVDHEGFLPRLLAELFERIGTERDQAAAELFPGAADGGASQVPTRARALDPALKEVMMTGSREGRLRVGLSVWEVLGNESVDLVRPGGSPAGSSRGKDSRPVDGFIKLPHLPASSLDFAVCHVSDTREALSVLYQALRRSSSWGGEGSYRPFPYANRGHVFVRLVVHDEGRERLSTLHLVDLAGYQSLSGQAIVSAGADPRHQGTDAAQSVQRESERRATNLSLLALSKLISEVAQASDGGEGDPAFPESVAQGSRPLLSVNESLLTQHLSPLLAGNCRTVLAATVSGRGSDYLDTVNTLRIATRAGGILTACTRSPKVPAASVSMLPATRVLSLLEYYPHGTHQNSTDAPSFLHARPPGTANSAVPPPGDTTWGRGLAPADILGDYILSSHAPGGQAGPAAPPAAAAAPGGQAAAKPPAAGPLSDEAIDRDLLEYGRQRPVPEGPMYDWEPRGTDLSAILAEGEKRARLIDALANTTSPGALPDIRAAVESLDRAAGGPMGTAEVPTAPPAAGDLASPDEDRFSASGSAEISSDRRAELKSEFRRVMESTGLGDDGVINPRGPPPEPLLDAESRSGSVSPGAAGAPLPGYPSFRADNDDAHRTYAYTAAGRVEPRERPGSGHPPAAAPPAGRAHDTYARPAPPAPQAGAPVAAGKPAAPAHSLAASLEPQPRSGLGIHENIVAALHRDLERQKSLVTTLQQEVDSLRSAHGSLGSLLDGERTVRRRLEERLREAELEALERQTALEVERETLKEETTKLSARCRQLQAESTMAAVFDKYEAEIRSLQARLDEAKRSDAARRKAEPESQQKSPASPGPSAAHGSQSQVGALQRSLRSAEQERARLEKELREAQRRERLHGVYERQTKEQLSKIHDMAKVIADREAEVHRFSSKARELEADLAAVRNDLQGSVQEHARTQRQKLDLEASVRSLRQQVVELRLFQQREVYKQSFASPSKRFVAAHVDRQAAAMELVRRLQKEVPRNHKVADILDRLTNEILQHAQEKAELLQKHDDMRDMLVEQQGLLEKF